MDLRMEGKSGIGEYVHQLRRRMPSLLGAHATITGFGERARGADVAVRARIYGLSEQWALPMAMAGRNLDVMFSPHYNVPLTTGVPLVVTVHDVIHLLFPGHLPRPRWLSLGYARFMLGLACRKARIILTPSEHTRRDLIRILGVPAAKIRVTPLGVDEVFRPESSGRSTAFRRSHGLVHGYLLAVGNLKPHKNHAGLVRAFAAARLPRIKLVIAGTGDPGLADLRALADHLGVADRVAFPGALSREELRRYYAAALAFVFPSFYEGFGIPPLEAMASGTPVIAARASSIPEVVGDAALLVNPHDRAALTRALCAVATKRALRRRLIARGYARSRRFCWDDTARLTAAALREAAAA